VSLLLFFANQRRRWFDQTQELPAEFIDGGWAALLQAEVAFQATPLVNAQLQLHQVQQELDELKTTHRLACKQHEQRAEQLATSIQCQRGNSKAYKLLENRTGRARRRLTQLAEVAAQTDFDPEVRLRYMQELLKQYFLTERDLNPDVKRK
jgi:hypothetical protein